MENQNCRAERFNFHPSVSVILKSAHYSRNTNLEKPCPSFYTLLSGHGNGFVTSEPKLLYLKSPDVKFMNHFTDLRNPLLKSFGSYKV